MEIYLSVIIALQVVTVALLVDQRVQRRRYRVDVDAIRRYLPSEAIMVAEE